MKAGDQVLVHLENCPETLFARFACARIGAICVSTNARAAGPELGWFAELTGARCAITQPNFASLLDKNRPDLDWLAITETDAGAAPAAATRPGRSLAFTALRADSLPLHKTDPALPVSIMFTTGTGEWIPINHDNPADYEKDLPIFQASIEFVKEFT